MIFDFRAIRMKTSRFFFILIKTIFDSHRLEEGSFSALQCVQKEKKPRRFAVCYLGGLHERRERDWQAIRSVFPGLCCSEGSMNEIDQFCFLL